MLMILANNRHLVLINSKNLKVYIMNIIMKIQRIVESVYQLSDEELDRIKDFKNKQFITSTYYYENKSRINWRI